MNIFRLLLVSTLLTLVVACSNSEQEFPLYKMNETPFEQVSVGGILAEYFYSKERKIVLDSAENQQLKKLTFLIEMAESYANTGNKVLLNTCETAWDSLSVNKVMINSKWVEDWITLNSILLRITANPKYGDEFEETIYNSLLGNHQKFNSELLSEEIAPTIYTRYLDEVYVNVFGNSSMEYEHTTGGKIRIVQDTKYPFDGLVMLKFETDDKRYVDLHIRIPKWAEKASVTVGGVKYKAMPGEYARVTKKWKTGQEVEIILPMRPFAETNNGHFSLQYGTLKMASQMTVEEKPTSALKSNGGDLYQFLKFVSPPGEVPTFTFNGYKDTTLVFQPYFFLDQVEKVRTTSFSWSY